MKKKTVYFVIIFILSISFYINEVVQLEYDVNLVEYFKLSKEFTIEENRLLKENQFLIYGGNINEAPLGIYYKENGQYMGLVVDYINAISIELGIPIISKPIVWNEALDSLARGETDLCDMIPSKERAKYVEFSDPIYSLRGLILVNKNNKDIYDIDDLKGKLIGVQKGDYSIEHLKSLNIDSDFIFTNNLGEALKLLDNNEVDLVMGDEPVIWYHIKELSNLDNYRILEKPLYDKKCVIGVTKDKKNLLGVINKSIFNLKRKGTLDKIHQKWSGFSSSFYEDNKYEKLKLTIITLIILVIIGGYATYLWNKSLKILVKSKTDELEITKNELQIAFNSMKSYLIVIGNNGIIKNINSSFLKYISMDIDNILNKKFECIDILVDFNNTYDSILSMDINSKNKILEKKEYKYKNRLYEVSIYPLKSELVIIDQKLIMIVDVTMDRIKEQKIVHSNRMEAIGRLASGIAHELRNPLGVIRNSTFILEDEYNDLDPNKLKALNAIDSAVNRSSKIIDNLLKFSRLTNDVEELVNLRDIIFEILQYFNKKFKENNIEVILKCSNDINLISNPESIKHILINLISNAIDAMPSGGNIEIFCDYTLEEHVKIIIKDEGVGISEELKEKVFDPFFTTKPTGKGTGLGLYIVYSELLKIKGDIKVESVEGKGTMFTIMILKRGVEYGNST
ncbi:ATP-binding protein [Tepidibacter aestuarii]|uniref:ATP-binding protein n=1 Tax=Tepidibacter aestuarii TaxID=2925782 RepID=UPI0020C08396|nr:transporter substrate-binding domain-containing protein [Tepidibacter aestuarii]CAH2214800.1 polar amino acid transport system substrate-binding protein [Tepidibacter aestuarii]